ncbi:EamA family transporter RarD [Rhodomicrobium lacus]|uniref:EamA family transporter RarD n=1 Tax=Rhodomicrobium lacus TaxID=2498452 RepID=UPI0013DFB129|nr:EamA family transporter RarD [Rhodomicrobium lacus]
MHGLGFAIATYIVWGLLPLYLALLKPASALEILGQRILWSLVFLLAWLLVSGHLRGLMRRLDRQLIGLYSLAAVLISVNWGVYILAVTSNRTVEASLGYFILPIINVIIGRVALGERLSPLQAAGVLTAAGGVAYLCVAAQGVPWIAFALALSFGFYGFIKKKAPLPAAEGLFLETAILALPAMMLLGGMAAHGELAMLHNATSLDLLLAGSGAVTAVPLITFALAAKRVPLSTIGMLQYLAPTLQFLIGVFVFGETLTEAKLAGFAIIWFGLVLYLYGLARRPHPAALPG